MAYLRQYDLRGQKIQDTYQSVLLYNSASGQAYHSQGWEIDLSASYAKNSDSASWTPPTAQQISCSWASQSLSASWAPFIDNPNAISASWASASVFATSSSFASRSISSSISDLSTLADAVLGLNIQMVPNSPNSSIVFGVDGGFPSVQNAVATTNESHPHATIKVGNKLYAGGWDGNLYVVNDPDGNLQDITSASFIGGTGISQVAYSSTTGYLYFIGGASPTGSIVKVDPNNINNQTMLVQGLPPFPALPGLAADSSSLYTIEGNTVYKFDINTGATIGTSASLGGSHGGGVFSPDGQWVYFCAGSRVTKVNTATISSSVNPVALSYFNGFGTFNASTVDDMAYLNGYVYVAQDASAGDFGLWKVNADDLSWTPYGTTLAYPTKYGSWGVYTDGKNIYVLQGNEIWIYLNGNLDNGPIRFAMSAGGANELWITNGGRFVWTSFNTYQIYSYTLPLTEVGINKMPTQTLDVGGIVLAYTLSGSNLVTNDIVDNGSISFAGSLHNTASNFIVGQDGHLRVSQITGSTPISTSGLKMFYISCSVISSSVLVGESYHGTASWAVSWDSSSIVTALNTKTNATNSVMTGSVNLYGELLVNDIVATTIGCTSSNFDTVNVTDSLTASIITASAVTASLFGTASYAVSASWAPTGIAADAVSASWASASISASYAVSASWAPAAGLTPGATYDITSSWSVSSSYSTYISTSIVTDPSFYNIALIQNTNQRAIHVDLDTDLQYNPGTTILWVNHLSSSNITASTALFGGTSVDINGYWLGTASYAYSSSKAVSASWADTGSVQVAGTNNNAQYAVIFVLNSGSNAVTYMDADNQMQFNPSNGTFNVLQITSSGVTASLFGNATTATSASYASSSTVTTSASYASSSYTASSAIASFSATSASWASASFSATSASYASKSLSSSYALSASWADAANATLTTGATYNITASWAVNVVNGGSGNQSATQSSYDISMKDMQYPFSAAFAGRTPATLNGSFIDANGNFDRLKNGSPSAYGLTYWFLQFTNTNLAGGNEVGNGTTASLAFHQMRIPASYSNGFTHSFQYFAMGTVDQFSSPIEGEVPDASNKVYWTVDLYVISSSTNAAANLFSTPTRLTRNSVTKSFSGAIHESGSMETVDSYFADANSIIKPDAMAFIMVNRINSDSSSILASVGDSTDYTGSVGMISSRVSWNLA